MRYDEAMNKIKEKFKEWLLKQGLAEKTKSGRPGTAYEYLKRIDRLSNQLYGKEDWGHILKDIHVLYLLHASLASKKNRNVKPKNIYGLIITYGVMTYVDGTGKSIIDGRYIQQKHIKKYLKWLEANPKKIHLVRPALEKLYDFYSQNKDLFDEINNIQTIQKDSQKQDSGSFFSGYFTTISRIKEAIDKVVFELKVPPEADGLRPRLIKAEDDPYGRVRKHLLVKEAAGSLDCSPKTLRRIASRRKNMFGNDGYSVGAMQRYLKKHHHPSKNATAATEKSKEEDWISGKEAADLLNCPLTTFIRKYRNTGLVSYTNYTPRKVRYYKPDIMKIKNSP